jgi:hypothetical protein
MEIVRLVLLFGHMVALAGLVGGLLVQLRSAERPLNATIVWSARLVLLFGLLLVGVLQADDVEVDNAKIGVKLVVALVVVALVEMNRRKPTLTQALYYTVLGLTFANVAVALFWSPAHGSY